MASNYYVRTPKKLPAPSAEEVLHCLVLDADAADYGTFEEWASNYGYETDSRKAEEIYRACQKTFLDLRRVLGHEVIEKLKTALQNY